MVPTNPTGSWTILQVIEYFQYRNTVNVEIKAVDNVVFPAVTICNHNRYR